MGRYYNSTIQNIFFSCFWMSFCFQYWMLKRGFWIEQISMEENFRDWVILPTLITSFHPIFSSRAKPVWGGRLGGYKKEWVCTSLASTRVKVKYRRRMYLRTYRPSIVGCVWHCFFPKLAASINKKGKKVFKIVLGTCTVRQKTLSAILFCHFCSNVNVTNMCLKRYRVSFR